MSDRVIFRGVVRCKFFVRLRIKKTKTAVLTFHKDKITSESIHQVISAQYFTKRGVPAEVTFIQGVHDF